MNPALKRIPKFGLLNRLYYAYCGRGMWRNEESYTINCNQGD